MGTLPAYVFPAELPPFQQELHALSWFRDNFTTNPKKLKKMNAYIYPLVPKFIQNSLCKFVARSSDPAKLLRNAFKDLDAFPAIMKHLIEEGNHGMIMEGSKVYGFTVDTLEKWLDPEKDGKWTMEDEHDIIDKALIHWMAKERLRRFKGRLVLFVDFGFSGTPFEVDHILPNSTWEKLLPIFKAEDDKRSSLEIEYLLNPEKQTK